MLSKTAIHTISALASLAERSPGTYVGAGELAREIAAPQNYLGKLLKGLGDLGLVESQKGKGGGFRLARPAARISLFEVADSIDHVSRWNGCFLGRARCADDDPCPVHCRWGALRDQYLGFLRDTTIADLRHEKRTAYASPD
jgi:Rrf2 family transcriptional regulator, iron-sulfur cluster assembly transcription factor